MFRKRDLSDKVYELSLFDILTQYAEVDDYVGDEITLTVRVPEFWVFVTRYLKQRYYALYEYNCHYSDIYKSAHKLGIMLLVSDPTFSQIRKYSRRVVKLLSEHEEDDDVKAIIAESLESVGAVSSKMHKCFGTLRSKVTFKPLPKWAKITYDLSYQTLINVSDLVRGAILYAFSTEYYMPELDEFRILLSDYAQIFKSTVETLEEVLSKKTEE